MPAASSQPATSPADRRETCRCAGKGVMLARIYDPTTCRWPMLAQPKIDGVRCRAMPDGTLLTRTGAAITMLPHITAAIQALRAANPILDGFELDGEIAGTDPKMPLETIAAACRMTRRPHTQAPGMAFHLFDLCKGFSANFRDHLISTLTMDEAAPIRRVPTEFVRSEAEADAHFKAMVLLGYEGQMLRVPYESYRRGRHCALLKRKPWCDAEGRIVGLVTGEKSGEIKSVKLDTGRGFAVATIATHFAGNPAMWRTPRALIGRLATYRFQPGRHSGNDHKTLVTIHPKEGRL